jgi:hypothetical protein
MHTDVLDLDYNSVTKITSAMHLAMVVLLDVTLPVDQRVIESRADSMTCDRSQSRAIPSVPWEHDKEKQLFNRLVIKSVTLAFTLSFGLSKRSFTCQNALFSTM